MDENQAKSLFKIEDIADDLIKLYAARESEKGYAFGPDDAYQKNSKMPSPTLKLMTS